MNIPVPTPPKKMDKSRKRPPRPSNTVSDLKAKSEKSKKLITYICTIPKKGGLVQVEIRATEMLDVGKLCYDKHGEYPINVEKKPFEMPDHLTQRLNSHEGLRALKKSMENTAKKAGRK